VVNGILPRFPFFFLNLGIGREAISKTIPVRIFFQFGHWWRRNYGKRNPTPVFVFFFNSGIGGAGIVVNGILPSFLYFFKFRYRRTSYVIVGGEGIVIEISSIFYNF
jgi:hypothetical protein